MGAFFVLKIMAANLPRPSVDENVSTTLASGVTDVANSADVGDASKIVAPSYLVVGRVDSAGTLRDENLWEYWKVTNVASNTLTITRAQGGSTAQAHSAGAVVEPVVTSSMFEDWYAALNPEHTSLGGHVITGTMTVAGMNLASVATIAVASIGHLNVSNGSISGIGLNPTWYIPSLPSAATTSLGRPASMPRPGTLQFVNVTLNGIISSPSVYFDINKNFVSIFDAGTRPLIANGTFVSTASISVKNFKAGDVLSVDLDFGGNSVDATVTASSF